ncbi:hypothetical protein NEOLEDRAFT_704217 [Neolentinus lepideus HHB14362 ss-1]|uniref:cAMP-independent regulatory protein pac2 n=1 Tax=Neolentinus lepideus HHB14362 ss-1 TaxID=1314782 RepID=A0A165V555_9AGAM|nr:hypothetical protein NEOLEDRAFT_704217 [Neolentinus lepideus HHB14362 ss-1]
MQQPTLREFRLRNVQDALKVFYACYLGILPLITRRLDNEERQALRPGDAYVWEGRNPQTDVSGLGIERWTEGKKWSQSRVREDLLYYYEKFPEGKTPDASVRLIRQTYSAVVNDPTSEKPRKLGLSTYYTENSLEHLHTVNDIPKLRDLVVPEGLFVRERKTSQKSRHALPSSSDQNHVTTAPSRRHGECHRHVAPRTYAPYPAPVVSPIPSRSSQDSYNPDEPSHFNTPTYCSSYPEQYRAHGYHQHYWTQGHNLLLSPYGTTNNIPPQYGYPQTSYYSSYHSNEPCNSSPSSSAASIYGEEPSPIEPTVSTSMPRRSISVPEPDDERRWPAVSSSAPYAVPRAAAPLQDVVGDTARERIGGPVYLAPLSDLRKDSLHRRDPADDCALRLLDQKQDYV